MYRILFVHVWRNGYKSEWGFRLKKIKQEERLKKERKSLRAEQENRDEKERFETEWREREEGKTVNKENVLKLTKNGIYCFEKILQKEISARKSGNI